MTARLMPPDKRNGNTLKVKSPCGNLYVTINRLNGAIIEVFVRGGNPCAASFNSSLAQVISLGLQHGVNCDDIIKSLTGARCGNVFWGTEHPPVSCADAIGRAIKGENDNGRP